MKRITVVAPDSEAMHFVMMLVNAGASVTVTDGPREPSGDEIPRLERPPMHRVQRSKPHPRGGQSRELQQRILVEMSGRPSFTPRDVRNAFPAESTKLVSNAMHGLRGKNKIDLISKGKKGVGHVYKVKEDSSVSGTDQ